MEKQFGYSADTDKGSCSTVIVGKNASATGMVLMGHNEDDYDCVVQMHRVPRVKHKEGDTLSFRDGTAVIPQVEETYSYLWSEYRSLGGISFADCFVNEWGVAVMSNSCKPCKVSETEPQKDGMGYALRRLIAERAKTAREGVEVAAALIEEYGYYSSRSYHICDKDEAWVLSVPTGNRFVARRIGDDEVYFIPNHFIIHEVDFTDTEHKNFYFSKDLVEYPIRNGWYTPAVPGDYSDFDFAAAYQDGPDKPHNILRSRNAWRMLTGQAPANIRMFSAKATRKYTPEDLKKLLRSHFEGTADDHSEGFARNPHMTRDPAPLCNAMTAESIVVEFNENPDLICYWRAVPKPCISPYVPWYAGITEIPKGYSWMDPHVAQPTHLDPAESELKYDPTKACWAFRLLQYFTEFDYKNTHGMLQESIAKLEEKWAEERKGVLAAYSTLAKTDPALATGMITSYTAAQAQLAWDWANEMIQKLGEDKIMENSSHPTIFEE